MFVHYSNKNIDASRFVTKEEKTGTLHKLGRNMVTEMLEREGRNRYSAINHQ